MTVIARLVGLLLLAVGTAAGWFFVLGPLRDAAAGAADVHYTARSFVLTPLLVVSGLALLLGGGSAAMGYAH